MTKLWSVVENSKAEQSIPAVAASSSVGSELDAEAVDLPTAEAAVGSYLSPGVLPADEVPKAIISARASRVGGGAPVLGILHLVKLLGPSMTDASNAPRRSRAIQLLSLVICAAAQDKSNKELTRQATRTLTDFFASTLDDASVLALSSPLPTGPPEADKRWPSIFVPPGAEMLASSISALTSLVSVDSFGMEATQSVCDALFGPAKEADAPRAENSSVQGLAAVMQRLTQGVRMLVYQLVDRLMAERRETLRRPKILWQFLLGYIAMARGEKDPRNLNKLFPLDRVILLEYGSELGTAQTGTNIEEVAAPSGLASQALEGLFDISFCYFPITFRAPPGGTGPTASTLRLKLRRVLSSHPGFAPLALPLFLEKLAATGGRSRRDTLRTLTAALPVYGAAEAGKVASSLWKALKPELVHPSAGEADAPDWANTQIAAQDTLIALLRTLYPDSPVSDDEAALKNLPPPEGIAAVIVNEMLEMIASTSSPFASLEEAQQAPSVLACLVRATARTSHLALYAGMETLLQAFAGDADATPDSRAGALRGIATLLAGLSDSYLKRPSVLASAAFRNPAKSDPGDDDEVEELTQLPDFSTGRPRTYDLDDRPLDRFRPTLLAALHAGVVPISTGGVSETDSSGLAAGLAAAVAAIRVPDLLHQEEITLLVQAACDVLAPFAGERKARPTADGDARNQLCTAIAAIAQASPSGSEVVGSLVLPRLDACLPSPTLFSTGEQCMEDRASVRHALASLTRIVSHATSSALSEQGQMLLASRLQSTAKTPQIAAAGTIGYARGLVAGWYTLASLTPLSSSSKVSIATLLDTFTFVNSPPPPKWDLLLADVAALMTVLARSLPRDDQAQLAPVLREALVTGNREATSRIVSGPWSSSEYTPLTYATSERKVSEASKGQSLLLISILVGLPANFSGREAARWAGLLALTLLHAQNGTLATRAIALGLADSLNKAPFRTIPEPLRVLLDHVFHSILGIGSAPQGDLDAALAELELPSSSLTKESVQPTPESIQAALHAYLLMVQALAARLSADAWPMIKNLLDLGVRSTPPLAQTIVAGLARVAQAAPGALTPENGHTIRKLAHQRTAAVLLPAIAEGYRSFPSTAPEADASTEEKQTFYLAALAAVLPRVPASARASSLAQVWPLLVRALQANQPGTAASAARAVTGALLAAKRAREEGREQEILARTQAIRSTGTDLLTSREDEVDAIALAQEHTGSLIPSLLHSLDASEEQDRLAALWALRALALTLPTHALWPRRLDVQRALSAAERGVDDPRRSVRTAAVETRDAWLTLRST